MERELNLKVATFLEMILLEQGLHQAMTTSEALEAFAQLLEEAPEGLGRELARTYGAALRPRYYQRASGVTHVLPHMLHERIAQTVIGDEPHTNEQREAFVIAMLRAFGTYSDHFDEMVPGFVGSVACVDHHFLLHIWDHCRHDLLDTTETESMRAEFEALHASRQREDLTCDERLYYDWWWPESPGRLPKAYLEVGGLIWRHIGRVLDAQELAVSQAREDVLYGAEMYRLMPKITGSLSWGMGTTGLVRQVDTEQYVQGPMMADIIRKFVEGGDQEEFPHQIALALKRPLHGSDSPQLALPFEVGQMQLALSPIESKVFVFMATHAPQRFGLIRQTLGELARRIYRSDDVAHLSRQCQDIAAAMHELDRVKLVLPDGTAVRIFDIRVADQPELAYAEQPISFGYSVNFLSLMNDVMPRRPKGDVLRSLRGRLLVNVDAAMCFDGNDSALMRHYVTAAAYWNDVWVYATGDDFPAHRLPIYEDTQWGLLTNSFSPKVMNLIEQARTCSTKKELSALRKKNKTVNDRWSRERSEVRGCLEELERRELLSIERVQWRPRQPYRFRLIPSQDHIEAYRHSRQSLQDAS